MLFDSREPRVFNIICIPGYFILTARIGNLAVCSANGTSYFREAFFEIEDVAMANRAGNRGFLT
jgi:hypothetical protein